MPALHQESHVKGQQLVEQLQEWARKLGFSQIGVAGIDLAAAEPGLLAWLQAGFHGDMGYMARHGTKRARPSELVPGTVSVITARMDYLPQGAPPSWLTDELHAQQQPDQAVVSVYARGRDYHKVLRQRLQQLADKLNDALKAMEPAATFASPATSASPAPLAARVFTDSAPVLEAELATRAGLGWRGKHTLVLSRDAGSLFFLGEIFVNVALPVSKPVQPHCGSCEACITVCPTQAIVAPYRLDARRCISYLTIEHAGAIPLELRPLMGNRIYGCDDCQLVCPWNKYAQRSTLPDFDSRQALSPQGLLQLWAWGEADFLHHTTGSAIRRIGYERWRRNLAVALGNAWRSTGEASVRNALIDAMTCSSPLVQEHIMWALAQRESV
jgi:epoxyqueuosine reductase